MKVLKLVCILSLVLFFNTRTSAQAIKSFTDEPDKFYQELTAFFEDNSFDKKEVNEFLDRFRTFWKPTKKEQEKGLPAFNESQRQVIYEICNLMLKKRLRPFPDFKGFLSSMMNFISTKQSEKSFAAWQNCINQILNGRAIKSYSEFIQMSENLFSSNTFYKSPTYQWSSNTNNYSFEFDSIPKVVFPSLTLRCLNTKNDSSLISNTSGTYYPSQGRFVGKGGKVTWIRTGLEPNVVYAELKKYQVVMKTGGYTADSVTFYNKAYFNKPLIGTLNEKNIPENDNAKTYPRFESNTKRFQIAELVEKIDFDGGFTMRGAKFIGSGNKDENAKLIMKRNGKPFLIATSKEFVITKEKLTSETAAIRIYLEKDSIYHPGLNYKYIVKDKLLTLFRSEEGASKTPFFNTYHAIDMYFEELFWKIDEPKIDLKMLIGSTGREADFQSANYFKEATYSSLQGLDPVHPLLLIRDFVKANAGIKEFSVDDLARFMKYTSNSLRPQLVKLSALGYLIYDTQEDRLQVQPRLFEHISNKAGKTDYDIINFHSVNPSDNNASINLLNNEMTIRGVAGVLLSDSQNVYLYPQDKKVVLKKNRDFVFAGLFHAGLYDFYGKEFSFDYDKFKVTMSNVDSARITVRAMEPNANGKRPFKRVKTVIEKINGEVMIDNPRNKSGRKPYPEYPVLNSTKDSYAFYQRKSIQGGVYNKDKFYFHLEPFTVDSMDNFSNAGMKFKGDFVSAGIFPTFKEELTLQSDYSLGFIRPTPAEGFAAYGGKGNYTNMIRMSHEGLRGDGTLTYLTSTTKSGDFIFFPDSMNTTAISYDIKEQKGGKVEYAQVGGENVYIHWAPYLDMMQSYNKEKPFSCFNKQMEFKGRLDYGPQQLAGKGLADFNNSQLEADKIIMKQSKMDSDTADFRLKALQESSLAFSTNNVNAHIDFEARTGEFKSNGKGSVVKFPVNQYICFMENFKWFMDRNDIELGSGKKKQQSDLDLTGPEFISVHPKQDSLRFMAPRARYDLKSYIISAMEVPYINVADARVIPDKGDVVIRKGAVMETLDTCKIIANNITKYHTVYNATVNIFARKSYAGSGYYDYIDETQKKQTFYFSNISVDTTRQTYAETDIKDSLKFMLSPRFEFKGKVKLQATNQFLVFSGATRIVHDCDRIGKVWFKFSSQINPAQIYIPVSGELTDLNGGQLAASIVTNNDSLYSAFLSKRRSKNDLEVLPAEGFLFFDKISREYRISSKEKLVERALNGNYLSLNTNSCAVYGEGKLSMATDLGQVKMDVVGNATHYVINDSAMFDLMFTLDFFFDDNAIEKMSDVMSNAAGLAPTNFSRPTYEKGLRELLGKEKADKIISQLNLNGSIKKLPDELKKVFFFTDIKMKWNPNSKSYLSQGPIGIGNINKVQLNKFLGGQSRIELQKKRGGDIITMYLEVDANTWYFFKYSRGNMQVISSIENFNTIIKELKSDKRQKKGEKNEGSYQFTLAPTNAKGVFLRKTE